MISIEPNIPDGGKYTASQACVILGMSYKTLMKRVAEGYLAMDIHRDGKKYFTGKNIKRFWRTY